MKGVIAAICLAAAIVGGSLWYTHEMTQISDELLIMSNALIANVEAEDYIAAAQNTEAIKQYINQKRTFLSATDNHERLDAIEVYAEELSGFVEGEQQTDAISHCRALTRLIERIPRDYKIRAESIL